MSKEMTQKGWISLYRSIQEHWLWNEKPFSKGQAWIDILLSANYQDKKFLVGNNLIFVKRGSFITSQKKLMNKWGWGSTKTRSFLNLLKSDGMIDFYSDKTKTSIVIKNYELYQNQNYLMAVMPIDSRDNQTKNKYSVEYLKNSDEEDVKTTNNNNNENNNNKIYTVDSIEYELSVYFLNSIKVNIPTIKKPNMQKWSKSFHYMMSVDKRDTEDIKSVIDFSHKHIFWSKNILNPDKLRKHYDRLKLEKRTCKVSTFNSFKQRTYDFDSLERKLLGWDKE